MSLHWTIIAGFLYTEIAVIALLLVPFISSKFWNKIFKSRFLKGLENQLIYYFYVLVTILILFFLDAIREMRKYGDEQKDSQEGHSHTSHLDVQMQTQNRLFRAQRNFYISGFALFLSLVIRRMVSLLSANACLEAEREAAMKQAQSASRAAETLMAATPGGEEKVDNKKLQSELETTKEELSKAKKDLEAMKTQAENVSNEYDRLMEEKDKLERKLAISGQGDKKDD